MRTLTLTRKKSFVGCACAVMIYLYCPQEEATEYLGNSPCKKVGELKNGQSASYEIGEDATVVFVAFSRSTPRSFYVRYSVPAGTENVALMTKPKFNPLAGNSFSIYPAE